MAENLVQYTIGIDFDTAIKKMEKFQKLMTNFEQKETRGAVARQKLDNAHAKERERHVHNEYKQRIKQEKELQRAHIAAIKENIKFDKRRAEAAAKAGLAPAGTKGADAHVKARQKMLDDQARLEARRQKERDRAHIAAIKENIKREKALRRDGNNAHVKAREKEMDRLARMEARRQTGLAQAQTTFGRSSLNLRTYQAGSVNAGAQRELRRAVAAAKTADEVRLLVAKERERLRVMKEQERSLNKQNFLMQRMTASSKQFAGNMVSAFAVGALGVGITQVGMEMEGINSAMLAVSGNAKLAAEDLKFVKEESMRLGKPLKESSDAFVKMNAARGNLSREQIKFTFTAIQETATVLGLTADQANRGNIAIAQMMS